MLTDEYLKLWLECHQSRQPQQFCKEYEIGIPVVAFDTAGVEDRVRDGVNGFWVKDDGEFEE